MWDPNRPEVFWLLQALYWDIVIVILSSPAQLQVTFHWR